MDAAAIIVKSIGLVLFLFTVRSVYRHFNGKMRKRSPAQGQPASTDKQEPEQQHSKAEHALNAFLLYAWFIFMTALSLGMVVNN
ncbi:MAG: hypothetical protein LBB74_06775 [Chitinispirillales bacterium]|jgi:hypothetical protein|nr:hypothetical protein [Chitinispirillales bacterium]